MKTREQLLQHAEEIERRRKVAKRELQRKLDTAPPAPAIDYESLDERTRAIVEGMLEVERAQMVVFAKAVNELADTVLASMDRMKGDIDRLFDVLKRSTADDAVSAAQRQRMQAH
jgi:hypothetical protein